MLVSISKPELISIFLEGKENDEEADNSMEKDLSTKQYCEPIKINEYDQQKEFGVERHLLNLLDNIVNNETITLEERKKQLRKVFDLVSASVKH